MLKDHFAARKVLAFQVREMRHVRRYSQEVVAELCGLNRSYIGAVERAEHNIGLDNIEKIAKGLEVPIKRLVDPSDPEVASDVIQPSSALENLPIIRTRQFLDLVRQCAKDRPDLLVIYLERCGCRFIQNK